MGSGKSFECVRSVIIPAVAKGRRVVTNIDGIQADKIKDYCVSELKIEIEDLGDVVRCTNDQVAAEAFFPNHNDSESFCKAGDLICIDEAWRFFGTDSKLTEEQKVFFREHRHYVDAKTKVSCDLVLMVQDITDIHRSLRVVIELNFKTTKLKSLGANSAYRVDMWEGYKQLKKDRVNYNVKKYDKKIFPLYSSYSGGEGKEVQVDSRQNAITKAKLIGFGVTLIILMIGLYYSFQYFNPDKLKDKSEQKTNTTQNSTQALANQQQEVVPAGSTWRIAGTITNSDGRTLVIVSDEFGNLRAEHISNFRNTESKLLASGSYDSEKVTTQVIPK